jgi:hypothetical protein
MTEHLPECPCVYHPSKDLWCICWRLLCFEKRITAAAVQRVKALTAGRERMEYDEYRADQVAAHNAYIDCVVDVIAAIKGDQS